MRCFKGIILLTLSCCYPIWGDHQQGEKKDEPEASIQMGPSQWTDFEVGLSGSGGYDPQVVKVEKRAAQEDGGSKPKHRTTFENKSTLRMDENASKDKAAANPETTPFTSYLNCNGKDGWLTTQTGPDGKAVSAKFNPSYDASGKEGENIPLQMLDASGNKVELSKDLQKNLTLNDKNNICGPAGGQLKQGNEPGQAGC